MEASVVATDPTPMCPLCEHRQSVPVETIAYDTIWTHLKSRHGARFSPEVIARNTPLSGLTTLSECASCGLQFFAPMLAGDPEFYHGLARRELQFAKDRWEFATARRTISEAEAVVDFGCGDGAFLRSLPQSQGKRAGVDHSAAFIRTLEVSGIEGYTCDFAEFAARERGAFDVACAFHVVEHLPRVGALVEAAITCLRPGGRLLISVPNRERISTGGFPVLDCPPHHVSRWTSEQFLWLANRFGLRVVATRFERRQFPPLQQIVRRGAPVALEALRRVASHRGTHEDQLSIEQAVRLTGNGPPRANLIRRMSWGHSMLADLRLPA